MPAAEQGPFSVRFFFLCVGSQNLRFKIIVQEHAAWVTTWVREQIANQKSCFAGVPIGVHRSGFPAHLG